MSSVCTCQFCIHEYLVAYDREDVATKLALPVPSKEVSKGVGEELYFWLQQNIHIVWIGTFYRLFACQWNGPCNLFPYDSPDQLPSENCLWSSNETAKVRFTCCDCGKVWTSISALAAFSLYPGENGAPELNLWFSLAGQSCSNCTTNNKGTTEKLHYGTWYPHEVARVLRNVHCKIGKDLNNILLR